MQNDIAILEKHRVEF